MTLHPKGPAASILRHKFQLAEIFEGAAYAAEKCPGLRVIEDNVWTTADEAGVTDEIYTPEWKVWESRGQMNARLGYEKNPRVVRKYVAVSWSRSSSDDQAYPADQGLSVGLPSTRRIEH
jgi:hypothetical protein